MRFKEIRVTPGLAVLALIALAFSSSRATAGCNPATSVAEGAGTYVTTSLGFPLTNSFDFDAREQNGQGKGKGTVVAEALGFDGDLKWVCVEVDDDTAILLGIFKRGTAGALYTFGLLDSDKLKGVAVVVGVRDGREDGDQVSETFLWNPSEVPEDPCDLLDEEAIDDFGNPLGATVRDYITAQLADSEGFDVITGGVEVCEKD